MASIIHSQNVFENQTNGTVFSKEGKLTDFPLVNGQQGVFTSWRYAFDAGKQTFRATDTDKCYEKRLVKDRFGNPQWTGWMEVSSAEAHGIQAIAINDQPLQLPNTDGAIKLQITPQLIGTFDKDTIYEIIDQKIHEDHYSNYEYVAWIPGKTSAIEVLKATYPEGGIQDKFYLVESNHNTEGIEDPAEFYTFKERTGSWEKINAPDMTAFVSYPAFDEHRNDKVEHITQEERETWNAAHDVIESVKESISDFGDKVAEINNNVEEKFAAAQARDDAQVKSVEDLTAYINEHTSDVGNTNSPHISAEERAKINRLFAGVANIPSNGSRYVVSAGGYTKAFEQVQTSRNSITKSFGNIASKVVKNGSYLIDTSVNLKNNILAAIDGHNVIERITFEVASSRINSIANTGWCIETNTGFKSDVFEVGNKVVVIDLPLNAIPDTIIFESDNVEDTYTLVSYKVNVTYVEQQAVDIGDPSKELQLNLVGPENSWPTYNGTSLVDLIKSDETASWGQIDGEITAQKDLTALLAKLLAKKVDCSSENNMRYDVYKNRLIKSAIQNSESIETVEVFKEINTFQRPNPGKAIFTGIKKWIDGLLAEGKVVVSLKLSAGYIASLMDTDGNYLPVSFKTDSPVIANSPSVVSGPFEWDWPGQYDISFDKIYLDTNPCQLLSDIKLEATTIQLGDVIFEVLDGANHLKSIKIHGADIVNEAANLYKIAAKAVEIEADTISVYGQEIDERYANKETFEAEIQDIKDTLAENASSDKDVETKFDGIVADLSKQIEDKYNETFDAINANKSEADDKYDEIFDVINTNKSEAEDKYDEIFDAIEASKTEAEAKHKIISETIESNKAEAESAIAEVNTSVESLKDELHSYQNEVESIYISKDDAAEAIATAKDAVTEYVDNRFETREEAKAAHDELIAAAAKAAKDVVDNANALVGESYDLVIASVDELEKYIGDGTFEASPRILFKAGTYDYKGIQKAIDFTKIKYIKGEKNAEVFINKVGQPAPRNYDFTKVEDIYLEIGYASDGKVWTEFGENLKEVNITGDVTIDLNEYSVYSMFKFNIEDDAVVTFTNVMPNRDYSFWFDQNKDVKSLKVTNFFHNGADEFVNGLENQKPGCRTIVKVTATNDATADAFILNEVIYGVVCNAYTGTACKVRIGNVKSKRLNSNIEDFTVNYYEGDLIGYFAPGQSFSISPRILDGWAHADGADYTVTIPETGVIIGTGKADETTTFTIPLTTKPVKEDVMPEVVIDFNLKPQIVEIYLDPLVEDYINKTNRKGFRQYQTNFDEVSIEFDAKSDYYVYLYEDDQGNTHQGTLPWNFIVPARPSREDFSVRITPKFYAAFDDVELELKGNYVFDKKSIVLTGKNDIYFNAKVPNKVVADENYGKLFAQAPITLLATNGVTGAVEYIDSGRGQEGLVEIGQDYLGKEVVITMIWPGKTEPVNKTFRVAVLPEGIGISGEAELHSYANEAAEFDYEIDWRGIEIFDAAGSWTTSNQNVVTIVEARDDKATIAVVGRGKATISFTSDFTGETYSFNVNTYVHAKSCEVPNVDAKTSSKIAPRVTFLDFFGNAISDVSAIEDTAGTYTCEREDVIDGNPLSITGIAIDDEPLQIGYRFIPADTYTGASNQATISLYKNTYICSITLEEGCGITGIYNITGASKSTKFAKKGGEIFTVLFYLNDYEKMSASNKEAIAEAFDDVTYVVDRVGQCVVEVTMPYNNVDLHLSAKNDTADDVQYNGFVLNN